jgi:hypothetical protein
MDYETGTLVKWNPAAGYHISWNVSDPKRVYVVLFSDDENVIVLTPDGKQLTTPKWSSKQTKFLKKQGIKEIRKLRWLPCG